MQLAEECGHLINLVSGHGGVEMKNVAVLHVEAEVLVLLVAQGFGEQAGGA